MSIYQDQFSSGQVIRAAGVTNAALQTWIRRGLIIGHGEAGVDSPGKPGIRRVFSFFNVMEVATAAALIDLGVDLRHAFRAAHRFAHSAERGRKVALPFENGRTVLCVAGDRAVELAWTPGVDVFVMARHHLQRPQGFTVLDLSDLFDRVAVALGYHPQRVLDDEYRGSTE